MTTLDLTGRLEALIGEITRSSAVTLGGTWRENGLDSLDLLRLVTTIEDELATSIPDSALDDPWGGRFALTASSHPTFVLSTAATGVELVSPGPDGL